MRSCFDYTTRERKEPSAVSSLAQHGQARLTVPYFCGTGFRNQFPPSGDSKEDPFSTAAVGNAFNTGISS